MFPSILAILTDTFSKNDFSLINNTTDVVALRSVATLQNIQPQKIYANSIFGNYRP